MGGTTADELNYSEPPTRICGQDELYAVDVIRTDKNRLCVDTKPSTLDKKYRVIFNNTETTHNGTSYKSQYSYSGSGLLLGFHFDTDSDKCQFKLVIDNEIVFTDLDIKFLKDIGFDRATNSIVFQGTNLFSISGNDLDFCPNYPIRFNSSVELLIKKSDATTYKISRYLVSIVKES